MSSHKYLCFDCLHAIKRDPWNKPKVICPLCGNECIHIGVRIPVPPKSKPKKWKALQLQLENEKADFIKSEEINNIARKHRLEKEIKKLEKLTPNKGRLSLIKSLKNQLNVLNT